MGDRSFSTNLLVLVLAATFVCPCSAFGSAVKPGGSSIPRSESRRDDSHGLSALGRACQPMADRHVSKLRGVLDDDPAILGDDSEDWLEGPTGFTPHYMAPPALGALPVNDQNVRMPAGPPRSPTLPIHFLCSYQC